VRFDRGAAGLDNRRAGRARGAAVEPWDAVVEAIREATGNAVRRGNATPVGGGCINAAWRLDTSAGPWFVKLNDADRAAMFAAEADGLEALAAADAVRVPRPLCHGHADGRAFLVLEHLELRPGDATGAARLGRALAAQHATAGDTFGWRRHLRLGARQHPRRHAATQRPWRRLARLLA
jgi:fructosamine-3-kinase